MVKIYRIIKRYKAKVEKSNETIKRKVAMNRKNRISFMKVKIYHREDVNDKYWKRLVEIKAETKIRDAYLQMLKDLNKLIP